jgi:hypothetical protein
MKGSILLRASMQGSDSPDGPWEEVDSFEELFGYRYWKAPFNKPLLSELSTLCKLWKEAGSPRLQ